MDPIDIARHMTQYFKKNKEYSNIHHKKGGAGDKAMMKTLVKLSKMANNNRSLRS